MHDVGRKQTDAVGCDGDLGQFGSVTFGPIRRIRREQLMVLLRDHNLTIGHDLCLVLMPEGTTEMTVSVSGYNVQGYFLELGGHGIEAIDEDVDDFFLAAAAPGTVVSYYGTRTIDENTSVRTTATYRHNGGVMSGSMVRKLKKHDEEKILVMKGEMIAVEGGKPAQSSGERQQFRLAAVC